MEEPPPGRRCPSLFRLQLCLSAASPLWAGLGLCSAFHAALQMQTTMGALWPDADILFLPPQPLPAHTMAQRPTPMPSKDLFCSWHP